MVLKRDPLSLVRVTEELLEWKSNGCGIENRDYWPWGSVALTTLHPLSTNFADKGRSLGRYSSLADYRPRISFCFVFWGLRLQSTDTYHISSLYSSRSAI